MTLGRSLAEALQKIWRARNILQGLEDSEQVEYVDPEILTSQEIRRIKNSLDVPQEDLEEIVERFSGSEVDSRNASALVEYSVRPGFEKSDYDMDSGKYRCPSCGKYEAVTHSGKMIGECLNCGENLNFQKRSSVFVRSSK